VKYGVGLLVICGRLYDGMKERLLSLMIEKFFVRSVDYENWWIAEG